MAKTAKKRAPAAPKPQRAKPIPPPSRPSQPMAESYTTKPVAIDFADASHRVASADLEILGVEHGEASYEGRVFFNNPKADASTPKTLENGYAGSFHVFGHGGCFGDVGHCEVNGKLDPFDLRDPHPLAPITKRVGVTDAIKYYARANRPITITVVPVVSAANELCDTKKVFRFKEMRFLSYNP